MKMKAARYESIGGPNLKWSVVLYPPSMNTDKHPHDWWMILSQREFKALGLRCPKKNEVLLIDLKATVLGDGAP